MSEWIQKLFPPVCERIDLCLQPNQEPLIQRPVIPTMMDELPQAYLQESGQISPFHIHTQNTIFGLDISLENPQQNQNIDPQLKRQSKPPMRNKQMGLIAESPNFQKKKYIKKNKFLNPKLQSQYPTKNFLQNFKGAHMEYLQSKVSSSKLQSHEIFSRLKKKSGISMEDYQQLYSITDFQQVFAQMFRVKHLYRTMMLSRSCKKSRRNHISKISVFEQSFATKVFDRIN